METIPYAIALKSPCPAFLRIMDDGTAKRAFFSPVALRSQMHRILNLLIDEYGLSTELEFELFGGLKPDGYARASIFQISSAFAETESIAAPVSKENDGVVLPVEITLMGYLQSKVPLNSLEGLAAIMSLIGINNTEANSGSVDYMVTVNPSGIDLERLDICSKRHVEQKAVEAWLPIIRRAMIAFFADCPKEMHCIPSRDFERLIAELWRSEGFQVTLTQKTWDGGYDVIAQKYNKVTGHEYLLIECTRRKKIDVKIIRELLGVMQLKNATKGILVTTSRLTGPAKILVGENSSRLMVHNYESLVEWLNAIITEKTALTDNNYNHDEADNFQ